MMTEVKTPLMRKMLSARHFAAAFAICLLLLSCCAVRYDVTLNTGKKLTNVTKPKYDKESSSYVFQDMQGKVMSVREWRVRAIEPHEDSNDISSQFRNKSDIPKTFSK